VQPIEFHQNVISMVVNSGPMAMGVLIILFIFSIISWAIMAEKYRQIKRAQRQNRKFLQVFRSSSKFSSVSSASSRLKHSPLVGLFQAALNELNHQIRASYDKLQKAGNPIAEPPKARLQNINSINRALLRASSFEVNKLERSLNFLATAAAVSPFLGLFGTIWGIMKSFWGIGLLGSANLSVVAPGISEALITTAVGLIVAIPAVIGYNFLLNKIKILSSEMDDFSLEFLTVSERNFS
jgi:biopolymer transport protein TolQ